jgi:hypothetical protein
LSTLLSLVVRAVVIRKAAAVALVVSAQAQALASQQEPITQ